MRQTVGRESSEPWPAPQCEQAISPGRHAARRGRPAEECDCPFCAAGPPTPEQIGELTPLALDIDALQDPMEVEIAASMVLTIGTTMGDDFDQALLGLFMPAFEAQATPSARALLAGLGTVADGEVSRAAMEAARRLTDAGVSAPVWLAELDARSRCRNASGSPIRRMERLC